MSSSTPLHFISPLEHAIVRKLANGDVGNDLVLTEAQQTLHIPRHVAYLAGVALHVEGGGKGKKRLGDLQRLYSSEISEKITVYSWSPRLCPQAEALSIIQRDLELCRQDIEAQSQRICNELLRNTEKSKQKVSAKQTNKQKKTSKPAKNVLVDNNDRGEGRQTTIVSSPAMLPELLKPPTVLLTADNDSGWTTVESRRQPQASVSVVQDPPSTADKRCEEAHAARRGRTKEDDTKSDPVPKSPSSAPSDSPLSFPKVTSNACSDTYISENKPPVLNQSLSNEAASALTSNNSIDVQNRTIAQLEQQLARLHGDREKERQEYEHSLQALQLRLYISETRLQTYEEALKDHIQAVDQNVAVSSPNRAVTSTSPSTGCMPTSPLYNRSGAV